MKPLTTPELLQVWEQGLYHSPANRAVYLLQAAGEPGAATLPIGQRDIRLLQLREWMFGSRLVNIAHCPHCSQRVEWENEVKDFYLQPVSENSHAKKFELEVDDFQISFRLPTAGDLAALHMGHSKEENTRLLLHRCLLAAQKNNTECKPEELPVYVLDAIEAQMGKEDAQADITVLLNCPACAHQWQSKFDIQSYLWAEINDWAKKIFQEVYILAKHFSWSEQDILHLTPRRRQVYLEMALA